MSEENLSKEQLLARFAEAQGVSEEEATNLVGGETADDVLNNIKEFTRKKIQENMPPMNRAQRRAWLKRNKRRIKSKAETIAETAQKLNYIELIKSLRELNEKKQKEIEENESTTENN